MDENNKLALILILVAVVEIVFGLIMVSLMV